MRSGRGADTGTGKERSRGKGKGIHHGLHGGSWGVAGLNDAAHLLEHMCFGRGANPVNRRMRVRAEYTDPFRRRAVAAPAPGRNAEDALHRTGRREPAPLPFPMRDDRRAPEEIRRPRPGTTTEGEGAWRGGIPRGTTATGSATAAGTGAREGRGPGAPRATRTPVRGGAPVVAWDGGGSWGTCWPRPP
ncbi:hypothetical protein GCM10022244_32210 [Streptomyces gulbargensis]|uniref:Uncharacterized protein n=1 Tax=Streptomyces gulbargensis TaxID=364901 RepID=A0ABP7MES5_9ACTN